MSNFYKKLTTIDVNATTSIYCNITKLIVQTFLTISILESLIS